MLLLMVGLMVAIMNIRKYNFPSNQYRIDSLMNIIALLKSYLILRLFWHFTLWNNDRSKEIAKSKGFFVIINFAIKSELKFRPFLVISIVMMVATFYIGFIVRTCEL